MSRYFAFVVKFKDSTKPSRIASSLFRLGRYLKGGVQSPADVPSCRLLEAGGDFWLGVSRVCESPNRESILVLVGGVVDRAICGGFEGDRVAFDLEESAERPYRHDGVAGSMGFRLRSEENFCSRRRRRGRFAE